jgi:hypothetical protein
MKSYSTSIELASTPKAVFNHVNEVSKWWLKQVGGTTTEFEGNSSKLNDEFILRHGDVHYSKHILVELIPDGKIVWLVTGSKLTWIKGNKQEWTGTKMVFEIVPKGEKTSLIFTHEGLVPELECYGHCVHFWERIIHEWLFNFITGDKAI